ncbi:MAG: ABC transporter substrate-binding protein [Patescibacteria group bacterium]
MIFLKRRLFFWLLKAYIKKWGRSFFIFFVLGCILFVLLLRFASGIVVRIPSASHTSIGMAGDYKVDGLPRLVLQDISMGLTRVDEDGRIKPGLAQSWKITQGGKKYEFLLKENQRFADGSMVDSSRIIYSFSDAVVERPSKQKIIFTLKDVYSPFLVSVSRPIFNEKFVGVGDYKIKKIDINGGFVRNIVLASSQNSFVTKSYQFYPSQNALKLAFLLGEIDQASGIMDTKYKNFDLSAFPNTSKHNITNFNKKRLYI